MHNLKVQIPVGSLTSGPMIAQPNFAHANTPLVPIPLVPFTVTTTFYPSESPQPPLFFTSCCPSGFPIAPNGFPIAPSPSPTFMLPPPSPNGPILLPGAFTDMPLLAMNGVAPGSLSPPHGYDQYLCPSPTYSHSRSLVESGSETFDDPTQNHCCEEPLVYMNGCEEPLVYMNVHLDDISQELMFTPDTINGIVLDQSRPPTRIVKPDRLGESLLRSEVLKPAQTYENSFTVSARSLPNHPEINICAEVNGEFKLAKMLSEDIGNGYVNVRFADDPFKLPGEIFYVTSNLEEISNACARPGLHYGLLTTDLNHLVRGSLLQPHCRQLIVKTAKSLMQVSIFVTKFVNENKDGIIRYGLASSMESGLRLFMHMKDKETETKFENLRARFSHLPKSSDALYQADKSLRRAAQYSHEIVNSGHAYLLNNDLLKEKFNNIDFTTPKSAKQLLAYFAKQGGIFPIGKQSLPDIRHLELSLKSINDGKHNPHFVARGDYANRCTKAIIGYLQLLSVEVVKKLEKYRETMAKVSSALAGLKWKLDRRDFRTIFPFQICEDSAESIMDSLTDVHYYSSRSTLYFKKGSNGNGTLWTEEKELRKALNKLKNVEQEFHNFCMKKLVKPLRRFCSQDDFKTVVNGEMVNPFFNENSDLDCRVLLGQTEAIFEECGIQHCRSEQHRFALLFENALAEEKAKAKVNHAQKQISTEDFWLMLYGRQMKKTRNQL